jgi:predicted small secreted protein
MFRNFRTLALVLLAAAPMLAACDVNEGPAERAGEKIDRAADRVGDRIEDATRR